MAKMTGNYCTPNKQTNKIRNTNLKGFYFEGWSSLNGSWEGQAIIILFWAPT